MGRNGAGSRQPKTALLDSFDPSSRPSRKFAARGASARWASKSASLLLAAETYGGRSRRSHAIATLLTDRHDRRGPTDRLGARAQREGMATRQEPKGQERLLRP